MTSETITYQELANRLDVAKLFNKAPILDTEIYDCIENGNLYNCYCDNEKCDIWDGDHEKTEKEILQWYLISANDADYLKRHTDELIFYSDVLDEYVWGITHYGTSWDCVYLDFKD